MLDGDFAESFWESASSKCDIRKRQLLQGRASGFGVDEIG